MNPWWRRPAAEDEPAPRERASADAEAQQEESAESEESAAAPPARVAAAAEAAAKTPAAEGIAAEEPARLADSLSPVAGGEPAAAGDDGDAAARVATAEDVSPAPEADVTKTERVGDGEHEAAGAGKPDSAAPRPDEAAISPSLEAATEPAQPARAADADRPPGRRRRRRGGRGRGRGRSPAHGDAAPGAVEIQPAAGASAPLPAVRRVAVLLDLGALQRSAGATPGLDPQGLFARLADDLGKLVLRRVYADAQDGGLNRGALHRGGAEVVDLPSNVEERGCSAAVRIVVDALELCYTKRGIDTVVLVASSLQMLPLVAKLQQNGMTVIGLGGADAPAQMRSQCDRFIDFGG